MNPKACTPLHCVAAGKYKAKLIGYDLNPVTKEAVVVYCITEGKHKGQQLRAKAEDFIIEVGVEYERNAEVLKRYWNTCKLALD